MLLSGRMPYGRCLISCEGIWIKSEVDAKHQYKKGEYCHDDGTGSAKRSFDEEVRRVIGVVYDGYFAAELVRVAGSAYFIGPGDRLTVVCDESDDWILIPAVVGELEILHSALGRDASAADLFILDKSVYCED